VKTIGPSLDTFTDYHFTNDAASTLEFSKDIRSTDSAPIAAITFSVHRTIDKTAMANLILQT
jgi:hypothetical protein